MRRSQLLLRPAGAPGRRDRLPRLCREGGGWRGLCGEDAKGGAGPQGEDSGLNQSARHELLCITSRVPGPLRRARNMAAIRAIAMFLLVSSVGVAPPRAIPI